MTCFTIPTRATMCVLWAVTSREPYEAPLTWYAHVASTTKQGLLGCLSHRLVSADEGAMLPRPLWLASITLNNLLQFIRETHPHVQILEPPHQASIFARHMQRLVSNGQAHITGCMSLQIRTNMHVNIFRRLLNPLPGRSQPASSAPLMCPPPHCALPHQHASPAQAPMPARVLRHVRPASPRSFS